MHESVAKDIPPFRTVVREMGFFGETLHMER